MELINLKRVLSDSTKDLIKKEVYEYAEGQKWYIYFGQVHIGGSFVDSTYEMVNLIIETVCKHYRTNRSIVLSKTRKEPYVYYRQLIHYLSRKYSKLHLSEIGKMVGDFDHSTVIHSIKLINDRFMEVDGTVKDIVTANQIDIIEQKLLLIVENDPNYKKSLD